MIKPSHSGPRLFQSLEELDAPDLRALIEKNAPRHLSQWDEGVSRRRFLELSTASLALAGLTACTRQPDEKIVPYVKQPEEIVPGRPLFFATAFPFGGYAAGVLAESHLGRPTKLEGNPDHPASLGGADAITQAQTLALYDPDRSQVITKLGEIETWSAFLDAMAGVVKSQKPLGGAGLRVLTQTVTSPTLAAQLAALQADFPKMKWHQWEPAGRDAVRAGVKAAFGSPAEVRYDFTRSDVVVAFESDFLSHGAGTVRYAKDFSSRRKVRKGQTEVSRFYAAESMPSATGTMADHRLAASPSGVARAALALAAALGVPGAAKPAGLDAETERWVTAAAEDLKAAGDRSLVVAGDYLPAAVHVLALAINARLGGLGKTAIVTEPVEPNPVDQAASIAELVADMTAGKVDTLLVLSGNPVYDAPAELEFGKAIRKVPLRVRLGLYDDETSELCHWQVPEAHFLESWSDARAFDGTVSIVQPLIEPLYGGKSAHEILATLSDTPAATSHELVKGYWQKKIGGTGFEKAWRRILHDGFVPATAAPVKTATIAGGAAEKAGAEIAAAKSEGLELAFRPDPAVHDGRFANNGWLQELPKPITKLTWDNAVFVSPATAKKFQLADEDVVTVTVGGRKVEGPVLRVPGHAADCATVYLGHGRKRGGRVAKGDGQPVGFDVYPLRTAAALSAAGATLGKTGAKWPLAITQEHGRMEGRALVRSGTLEEFRKEPEFAKKMGETPGKEESLYPGFEYKEYAWGLSVDLNSCTGCNACVVACVSENNSPVVGKDQVQRGREMHWIRIDRYFEGDENAVTAIHHQPVMCQQCENAPCEVVCPVGATVHSDEGINDMVYNRCVGTKYCSNNCPYKVRRFNFFEYDDKTTPVLKLMRNPDVTVRTIGVMEKCNFCIQRIHAARIPAEREGRGIRDGEIKTACQQTCPADAIVFGNINDPAAHVTRLKAEPLDYGLLAELNTRPRTTYLAKVKNPRPGFEKA